MSANGASEVDFEYRKILVIGAKKTGKTSILSTAVGGDFSRSYRPSARCSRYYDVQNMLELIDCPGLDDTILNGTKDSEEPLDFEAVRAHYHNFRDDSIVQEMLTEPKEKGYKENLLIDVDITEVDAYLIVYTDDDRSKRVAKALRLAILTKRMHDNRRAIFLLHHQGDFDTPPFITRVVINDDTRQMEEEKNDPFVELVFRDDVGLQTKAFYHKHLRYLPACSAQTGDGVARALAAMRLELDRMDGRAGGGEKTKAGAPLLGRRHVPADLFTLAGGAPAGAVANLRATGGAATATAGQSGAAGGGGTTTGGGGGFGGFFGAGSERKAQPPKKGSRDDADDEDDGAPVTDKGQRAQCSSMAAAACNIQ